MTTLPECTCARCAPEGTPTPFAEMKAKREAQNGKPISQATHAERADVTGAAICDGLNRNTSKIPEDGLVVLTRNIH